MRTLTADTRLALWFLVQRGFDTKTEANSILKTESALAKLVQLLQVVR